MSNHGFNKIKNFIKNLSERKFNYVKSFVLNSGLDLDTQDDFGNTLLHYSCREGKIHAVKFLLENGANPEIANNDGRLPIHLSSIYGVKHQLELFAQNLSRHNKPGKEAKTSETMFELLFRYAPKTLHVEDNQGKSPLDYYAKLSKVNVNFLSSNINKIIEGIKSPEKISQKVETYLILRNGKKHKKSHPNYKNKHH